MKYQNIPFFIATESIEKSKTLGKFLSRKINTQYEKFNAPEIYNFLKNCNRFSCFIFDLQMKNEGFENIVKSINQKDPNYPIILITYETIVIDDYRYFLNLGVSDVLVINQKDNDQYLFNEVIRVLTLKWRSYLYTINENKKVYQASVVTINHEINQPLTVILNAIGLLKSELMDKEDSASKINKHLNFISKSVLRIQSILDTLKKVKKLELIEYTKDVWMVNLYSNKLNDIKIDRTKINNKNTVLIIDNNLDERIVIENAIKKMGLYKVNVSNFHEAEQVIRKISHEIQAIFLSASLPTKELENLLFESNNQKEIIPLIIIQDDQTSSDNIKLINSTAFQILNKPILEQEIQETLANSVIVKG